MKRLYFIYALLVATTFYSCKKVIDLKLKDATPLLIIQGNVTNVPGFYDVSLNKSVSYSSPNVFPAVSGASVKITDSTTGLIDVLKEISPGIYRTLTLQGVQGHTYILDITAEGKTYKASSIMPKLVNLDSVSFLVNTGFGETIINPVPNFQDPANQKNHYRFIQSINNKAYDKIFLFDDRLSDGKYMARQLFNDSAYIQIKDTVQLEMQCIDKRVFEYYKQLSGLDPTNGQPTSPTNPDTNISGGALGYFSAHTVQKKKAVVKS